MDRNLWTKIGNECVDMSKVTNFYKEHRDAIVFWFDNKEHTEIGFLFSSSTGEKQNIEMMEKERDKAFDDICLYLKKNSI